jgi:hypothetical protein
MLILIDLQMMSLGLGRDISGRPLIRLNQFVSSESITSQLPQITPRLLVGFGVFSHRKLFQPLGAAARKNSAQSGFRDTPKNCAGADDQISNKVVCTRSFARVSVAISMISAARDVSPNSEASVEVIRDERRKTARHQQADRKSVNMTKVTIREWLAAVSIGVMRGRDDT